MSSFWEPPPLLAVGAVVGSVILAYAVGFATSHKPASPDTSGGVDHSAREPRDGANPAHSDEGPSSNAKTQTAEMQTGPAPVVLDPKSATES